MTKKNLRREICEAGFGCYEERFDGQVENFKRRRALPPLSAVEGDSEFFNRILNVKKIQEMIFITKTVARTR